MIYFKTCAYNAEKTIKRAMDSVLSQSIEDFMFYILENGSTDGTRKIIQEYEKKDSRIVAFYSEINRNYTENEDFWNLAHHLNEDDYLIILDADDYYEPTFTEEVLRFMDENGLDVAACGTVFEDEDENVRSCIVQNTNLILRTPEEYDKLFMFAHWNTRQIWGKIYKGNVAKYQFGNKTPKYCPKAYGGDTVNVMHCLLYSKGFGVLAKALHHYQMSTKSVSHQWLEGREDSENILDDVARKFLLEKAGRISDENRAFLDLVYLNGFKDTCMVLLKSQMEISQRMERISKLFSSDNFKSAILTETESTAAVRESILNIRSAFLRWTIEGYALFSEEDRKYAYEFLVSYGDVVAEVITPAIAEELFAQKPEIISSFLSGKVGSVIKLVPEYINEKKESETLTLEDIVFAQNMMAYLGMESLYIVYTKQFIEKLIEEGSLDKALQELEEWMNILPQDEDFVLLYQKIKR